MHLATYPQQGSAASAIGSVKHGRVPGAATRTHGNNPSCHEKQVETRVCVMFRTHSWLPLATCARILDESHTTQNGKPRFETVFMVASGDDAISYVPPILHESERTGISSSFAPCVQEHFRTLDQCLTKLLRSRVHHVASAPPTNRRSAIIVRESRIPAPQPPALPVRLLLQLHATPGTTAVPPDPARRRLCAVVVFRARIRTLLLRSQGERDSPPRRPVGRAMHASWASCFHSRG